MLFQLHSTASSLAFASSLKSIFNDRLSRCPVAPGPLFTGYCVCCMASAGYFGALQAPSGVRPTCYTGPEMGHADAGGNRLRTSRGYIPVAVLALLMALAFIPLFTPSEPRTTVTVLRRPQLLRAAPRASHPRAAPRPPFMSHVAVGVDGAHDVAQGVPHAPPQALPPLAAAADAVQASAYVPLLLASLAVGLGLALTASQRQPRRRAPAPWETGEDDGTVPRRPPDSTQYNWGLWPALPLQPYSRKVTLETEVVKDLVWTHDQCQGTGVLLPQRPTP